MKVLFLTTSLGKKIILPLVKFLYQVKLSVKKPLSFHDAVCLNIAHVLERYIL